MNTSEAAEALGVDQADLRRWRSKGCPVGKDGGRLSWSIDAVSVWIAGNLKSHPDPAAGSPRARRGGVRAAEGRRKEALAARYEHDLAVLQERYIERTEVTEGNVRRVHALKRALLQLPHQLEGRTAAQIETRLRDLLEEFARGGHQLSEDPKDCPTCGCVWRGA